MAQATPPGSTPSEVAAERAAVELVGRTLGGRFRVERLLKRGGMGAVYVARDVEAGIDVAIKVVKEALLEDPSAIARFRREAKLLTEIADPRVVRAFAAGDDAGLMWIAMELVDGETLRERIDERGRFEWRESLPLVVQVCQALQAVHARGVTHRDLKPENIMLVRGDALHGSAPLVAKLLDFGVAKGQGNDGHTVGGSMTGTGLIVGTPGYVAPEVVLEGKTTDPRSDLYALGVVWFEMLTAQRPFSAKTPVALAMKHAHEPAPSPTSLLPFSPLPAVVDSLVLRLLEKDPDNRLKDASALLDAVREIEQMAEAAKLGTPLPERLSAFQPTMTDAAPAATGVMPSSELAALTPRPSSVPSSVDTPGTSSVVRAPLTAGAPTPEQLLDVHRQAQQATQGAQRMKRIAIAAGIASALTLAVAAGVVVLVVQRGPRDDGQEQHTQQPPQPTRVPPPTPRNPAILAAADPRTSSVPAVHSVEGAAEGGAADGAGGGNAEPPAKTTPVVPGRAEKGAAVKVRAPTKIGEAIPASPPSAVRKTVKLVVRAAADKVEISVDGSLPNAPWIGEVTEGEHRVRYRIGGRDVTEVVVVPRDCKMNSEGACVHTWSPPKE